MLFKRCPRRYFYVDVGIEVPVLDETPLWFGRSIHKGIEDYYGALNNNPTVDEIKRVAEQAFNRSWDSRLSNRLRPAKATILSNFTKFEFWRLENGEKPFKPEVLEKDLASDKFHCLTDWYHGGRLIDWKTGQNAKITEDLQLEMWVQAEVLEANGFTVDSIQLCFLRFNKFLSLPPPNKSWLYEQRKEVMEAIQLNYFPPNVSILCHWCPYKIRCEYDGIKQKIIIALIENPEIGKYVIVHAGYAIEIMNEKEAMEAIAQWKEIAEDQDLNLTDVI